MMVYRALKFYRIIILICLFNIYSRSAARGGVILILQHLPC
jgi:hypothetical protein